MGRAPGDPRASRAKESATSEQPATPGRTAENDPSATTTSSTTTGSRPRGRRDGPLRRITWLLPALAFVVGLVLGGVVVGAIASGSDGAEEAGGSTATAGGAPRPTAPASPGSSGDTTATIRVPAECAALAGDARNAAALLQQAAKAARDLDANALADVARRMQDERDRLTAQADACQGASPSVPAPSS
jgi:hypothetical protein